MSIDSALFRSVLGAYPTGVVVVTAADADGERHGLVIGSFTSISLDPPLVGFFPDRRSRSWAAIAPIGRFCVNVLGDHQEELCRGFAVSGGNKFEGVDWHPAPVTGAPMIFSWRVFSALLRRLSTIANRPPNRLAWPRARLMLPSSGLTTTMSSSSIPIFRK